MTIKKLLSLFSLLVLLVMQPSIAYAQDIEEEGDYTELEKGQEAPHDGLLFTKEAIIKLAVNEDTKLQLVQNQNKTELSVVKNNLETELKKKELEVQVLKEQNKELTGRKGLESILVPVSVTSTILVMLGLFYISVQIVK